MFAFGFLQCSGSVFSNACVCVHGCARARVCVYMCSHTFRESTHSSPRLS
jgi:hypothetical protein